MEPRSSADQAGDRIDSCSGTTAGIGSILRQWNQRNESGYEHRAKVAHYGTTLGDECVTEQEHPPMASKLVLVDFDSTIIPWGPLMEVRVPFPGVPEAMRKLKDAGYTIGIFTSRMSRKWIEHEVGEDADGMISVKAVADFMIAQRDHVTKILNDHGIPFDLITAEKIPSAAYFDDKAIGIRPNYPLNVAIEDFLNAQ